MNTLNRRHFLRITGLGAAALTAPRLLRAAETARKPNIIYIMADDLGYGDLSCYGQKKFKTPNLDRMAAEGLKFTDHYSGSTVCAPSRCCLMTGLHTGHAYIRGNREVQPEGQAPIPADTFTVAKMLKQAGYATGMFGKWGLGPPASEGDPVKQGFDEFFGYNCQRQAHNYYPEYLWHNTKKVPLDGTTYSHDLIVEKALAFIKANGAPSTGSGQAKPFFCYVPVTIPHASMHVPEDSHKRFREKFPQFENKIGRYSGPTVKNPIAAFAGMVTRLDGQVGQLIALLKKLGIDENTLVIFTSDNGPHYEGGHDPNFFDSNGPLRGGKRALYEGGIRVPFIARWPGKIKPGGTTDLPSAFWDLLPTCAEIAGVKPPDKIDGISYLPTLLGQTDKQKKHDYLYWEFRGGNQAVRKGNWKAISFSGGARFELHDLKTDLGEMRNVADKHPDVAAEMKRIMQAAHVDNPMFPLRKRKPKGKGGKKGKK